MFKETKKKKNSSLYTFLVETIQSASSKYTYKYSLLFTGNVRHLVHLACVHLAL